MYRDQGSKIKDERGGAGPVACMCEERKVQGFGGGNMKEREHFNRGVRG